MSDNYETVEEVCEQLVAKTEYFIREYDTGLGVLRAENFAKRILSAYKREVEAKDEQIERLERMKADYLNMQKNMKNLRAEITLKQNQMCNYNQIFNAAIMERHALIKELADMLEKFESIGVDCSCCGIPCDRFDRHEGCIVDGIGALVDKAEAMLSEPQQETPAQESTQDSQVITLKEMLEDEVKKNIGLSNDLNDRNAVIKELAETLAVFIGCKAVRNRGDECFSSCTAKVRCGRQNPCELIEKARKILI